MNPASHVRQDAGPRTAYILLLVGGGLVLIARWASPFDLGAGGTGTVGSERFGQFMVGIALLPILEQTLVVGDLKRRVRPWPESSTTGLSIACS